MDLHEILQPVSREPLSARVATTIKRYILSENLQPGDALPSERQLAGSLVVSRTVLREALGMLVGEGIISKHAGRGIFVVPFDRERVLASFSLVVEQQPQHGQELVELRRAVEVGAIGLAAERIDAAGIGRLRALIRVMESKLGRGENLAREDVELHRVLLAGTGNPLLQQFSGLIEEVMRLSVERNLHGLREERDERAVREMAGIVEAVAAGDVWEARRRMEEHLCRPASE